MPSKKATEAPEVNLDEWTPERFQEELIDKKTGKNKPFTEENKAALYALSREEALQLDPRIFARWKFAIDNKEMTRKSGKNSVKKRRELKDWSIKVRELLGDPEIAQLMLNQKRLPKWLNVLEEPTAADVIVATLMAKAMTGDVRAVEELRKMGFGDKVVIDAGQSFFNKNALKLEIIAPDHNTKIMEAEENETQKQMDTPVVEEAQETVEVPTPQVRTMPSANEIQGDNVPANLQAEFDRQEQERQQPKPTVDSHGIDRSILSKVTITKNKPRQ